MRVGDPVKDLMDFVETERAAAPIDHSKIRRRWFCILAPNRIAKDFRAGSRGEAQHDYKEDAMTQNERNSRNDNPNTIWNVLARKLGREPTDKEAADEVKRICARRKG